MATTRIASSAISIALALGIAFADAAANTTTREEIVRLPEDIMSLPCWPDNIKGIRAIARDRAGQEGRSPLLETPLPKKEFTNPVARVLEDLRCTLAQDSRKSAEIAQTLQYIARLQSDATVNPEIHLALHTIEIKIATAQTHEDLYGAIALSWDVMLALEKEQMSEAERRLREAEEALRQALEDGAPPEELERLMDDVNKARDEFIDEQKQLSEQDPSQALSPEEIAEMQELAREQNKLMEEFQKMKEQLGEINPELLKQMQQQMMQQNMQQMQNMRQDSRRQQMTPEQARQQQKLMQEQLKKLQQQMQNLNDLQKLVQEQQKLLNETRQKNKPVDLAQLKNLAQQLEQAAKAEQQRQQESIDTNLETFRNSEDLRNDVRKQIKESTGKLGKPETETQKTLEKMAKDYAEHASQMREQKALLDNALRLEKALDELAKNPIFDEQAQEIKELHERIQDQKETLTHAENNNSSIAQWRRNQLKSKQADIAESAQNIANEQENEPLSMAQIKQTSERLDHILRQMETKPSQQENRWQIDLLQEELRQNVATIDKAHQAGHSLGKKQRYGMQQKIRNAIQKAQDMASEAKERSEENKEDLEETLDDMRDLQQQSQEMQQQNQPISIPQAARAMDKIQDAMKTLEKIQKKQEKKPLSADQLKALFEQIDMTINKVDRQLRQELQNNDAAEKLLDQADGNIRQTPDDRQQVIKALIKDLRGVLEHTPAEKGKALQQKLDHIEKQLAPEATSLFESASSLRGFVQVAAIGDISPFLHTAQNTNPDLPLPDFEQALDELRQTIDAVRSLQEEQQKQNIEKQEGLGAVRTEFDTLNKHLSETLEKTDDPSQESLNNITHDAETVMRALKQFVEQQQKNEPPQAPPLPGQQQNQQQQGQNQQPPQNLIDQLMNRLRQMIEQQQQQQQMQQMQQQMQQLQQQLQQNQQMQQQQQQMQQQLQEMMQRMQRQGQQQNQPMDESQQSMGQASQQLGQGQKGQAASSQQQAIQQLQQAAQQMQKQMQQQMRQMGIPKDSQSGQGAASSAQRQPPGRFKKGDTDPLGRNAEELQRDHYKPADQENSNPARDIQNDLIHAPCTTPQECEYRQRLLKGLGP